jgi:secreted trypsin-like serine protease
MYNKKIAGGRIIGGEEANAGQFPFAAAIYKSTADGTYFWVFVFLRVWAC